MFYAISDSGLFPEHFMYFVVLSAQAKMLI